jgi:glutathione S-transferase
MFTVYGFPNTRSTRITWMLEELEVPYQFHLVNLSTGDAKSPDYLAINPSGKVPAIKVDDTIILESGGIVAYLGDCHPEAKLVPKAGTLDRARYDQWSYFALCELEQPLWTMGKNKFALPKEQRCRAILPTAEWEFQQALQLLSTGLGSNDYILDNQFSAADILLGHTLFWGAAFKQPIHQENLQAYMARLSQRPALARANRTEQAAMAS